MKPVLIISHATCEAPGYLREFLDRQAVVYRIVDHDDNALDVDLIEEVAGLVFLGSPVSVNDDLSWIDEEIKFIQLALDREIPVLGLCFGAQLMARALGAEVCSASSMQIGWHQLALSEHARRVFQSSDLPPSFFAFEWHGDTFSTPVGALPLFTAACIENQGFAYKNCLALQFHPEITESMVYEWLDRYQHCLLAPNKCIQSREEILMHLQERLAAQRLVADDLFGWWLDQLKV